MAAREASDGRSARALQAAHYGDGSDDGAASRTDTELRRMAAFRVRETANRIATLAQSAQNEELRRELLSIAQRLKNEERRLFGDPE
ncbi:hypothetical protein KF840_24340 [bacterium]|nr:hypothetical protein [bacterium]